LARAGGPEHEDVRLGDLDELVLGVLALGACLGALVVVVDGDGERLLRLVLADDVLVEEVVDLPRLRQALQRALRRFGEFFLDDLVAEIDALVADVDPGARDELPYLLLALAAERALEQVAAVTDACHLIALLYARSRRATDRTSRS